LSGGSPAAAQTTPGGRIAIHVPDLFSAMPANGVKVALVFKAGEEMKALKSVTIGPDGWPDLGRPLSGDALTAGPPHHIPMQAKPSTHACSVLPG
jgi:5-hydroxyisourate hydrolase-like protein (transthyretin family)